jgi:thioredoxin-related protein
MSKVKVIGLAVLFLGLLAVLTLPDLTSKADAIPWEGDYEAALKKADASDRLLLVYLYTDWCTFCRKMDRETFEDENLIEDMAAQYVWVRLNAETQDHGVRLRQEMGISGFPTTLLMNGKGEELDRLEGFIPPQGFQELVREKASSPDSIPALKADLEKNPDSAPLHYRIGRKYLERRDFPQAQQAFARVIELDPENRQGSTDSSHYYLAVSLASQEQLDEALEHLQVFEKEFENSEVAADVQVLRGLIHFHSGDIDAAREVLRTYLRDNPEHRQAPRIKRILAELDTPSRMIVPAH